MLLNVHIKNLALIDDANITFTDKLNILTGETGAGKSIIIGALKIGMGGKLPKDILRDSSKEGFCQLLFIAGNSQTEEALREIGIQPSEDGEIIITRRIVNNRTINTINDVAVTAAKLKEAATLLVDLHAQHDQQTLLKKAQHLNILDKFGKERIAPLQKQVEKCYREYAAIKKELEMGVVDEAERARRQEFIRYEISEIESANIKSSEDDCVEAQYNRMVHGKDIVEAAQKVYQITGYGENGSAGNEIGRALLELKSVKGLDTGIETLYGELENIDGLLNDFNVEISNYMQSMEFDEAEYNEVLSRLNVINDIKGKYGRTIDEVNEYLVHIQKEYERLEDYEEYMAAQKERLRDAKKRLDAAAEKLTEARKKEAKILCDKIREALVDLSFMEVRFDMVCNKLPECGPSGQDDCYFMISTNVGEEMKPLYDVASGGELSRIMLAIKSCMAAEDNIDTLIFDEIDVGISGRAAQKVAEKLAVISKNHQVISITHLPQIAAMADDHYRIDKLVCNHKTVTQIERLDNNSSVHEIARLLGGARITETVLCNAREMKELAEKYKKEIENM